ncbi:DUF2199 domain-containing protein [Nocardia aurantia]|uniref:DUF2199 domain-containing protein n=1 Tax=Nocardia aurantia TaxID=2585199 RepID=UPI00387371E9
MSSPGFWCGACGLYHDGLPLSYGSPAPAYWHSDLEDRPDSFLAQEECVIGGEQFFLRGRVVLPVVDTGQEFDWGVWVSVSRTSYERIIEIWDDPQRVSEPPFFGWLSSDIDGYQPTTLNLKTRVHTQRSATAPPSNWNPPTIHWRWNNAPGSPSPASAPSRNGTCTGSRNSIEVHCVVVAAMFTRFPVLSTGSAGRSAAVDGGGVAAISDGVDVDAPHQPS